MHVVRFRLGHVRKACIRHAALSWPKVCCQKAMLLSSKSNHYLAFKHPYRLLFQRSSVVWCTVLSGNFSLSCKWNQKSYQLYCLPVSLTQLLQFIELEFVSNDWHMSMFVGFKRVSVHRHMRWRSILCVAYSRTISRFPSGEPSNSSYSNCIRIFLMKIISKHRERKSRWYFKHFSL
jgi:hypothetical protein